MKETFAPVSSCALIVSYLWHYSVVEAAVLPKYYDVMWCILKFSASGSFLQKEVSGFLVTNEYDELNESKDSTESSSVET